MRLEMDFRLYEDNTSGLTLSLEVTDEVDGVVEPSFDLGPWLLAFERMVLRGPVATPPQFSEQFPVKSR